MLEFFKTFEDGTRKIQEPEPGCWINAVAPTEEERNYLIEQIGVLPEFVKSSLYTFPICVTLPFQANTTPHGGSVHGAF